MAIRLDERTERYRLIGAMTKRALTILILSSTTMQTVAGLTIFAAASTMNVMKELAAAYEEDGGEAIRFNFAASGALARQIDAGAPADIFVSASVEWMDFLEDKQLLLDGSRMHMAGNRLVLVAPVDSGLTFDGFPANSNGKLAVGDFKSVPAGRYAKQALTSLGWWDAVQGRLVQGSNVRSVLMYVERGEVDAGIVYHTDAVQSQKVKALGTFPIHVHAPIVYPAACLNACSESAQGFLAFLKTDAARSVLEQYGFAYPAHQAD